MESTRYSNPDTDSLTSLCAALTHSLFSAASVSSVARCNFSSVTPSLPHPHSCAGVLTRVRRTQGDNIITDPMTTGFRSFVRVRNYHRTCAFFV